MKSRAFVRQVAFSTKSASYLSPYISIVESFWKPSKSWWLPFVSYCGSPRKVYSSLQFALQGTQFPFALASVTVFFILRLLPLLLLQSCEQLIIPYIFYVEDILWRIFRFWELHFLASKISKIWENAIFYRHYLRFTLAGCFILDLHFDLVAYYRWPHWQSRDQISSKHQKFSSFDHLLIFQRNLRPVRFRHLRFSDA